MKPDTHLGGVGRHHWGQTLLPLVFSEGVRRRGSALERLAVLVATTAARIFRLFPRKGAILPGPMPTSSSWTQTASGR